MHAITIGLDIAKSVFQVHIADATGRVLQQKKLRRSQVEAFFARQPRGATMRRRRRVRNAQFHGIGAPDSFTDDISHSRQAGNLSLPLGEIADSLLAASRVPFRHDRGAEIKAGGCTVRAGRTPLFSVSC